MSVLAIDKNSKPVQAMWIGTCQKKGFTSTSAQSTAVGASSSLVMLQATANCHVKFGSNPTATADGTSQYIQAGAIYVFPITGGHKIAIIRDSADGDLFITEGAV